MRWRSTILTIYCSHFYYYYFDSIEREPFTCIGVKRFYVRIKTESDSKQQFHRCGTHTHTSSSNGHSHFACNRLWSMLHTVQFIGRTYYIWRIKRPGAATWECQTDGGAARSIFVDTVQWLGYIRACGQTDLSLAREYNRIVKCGCSPTSRFIASVSITFVVHRTLLQYSTVIFFLSAAEPYVRSLQMYRLSFPSANMVD